MVFPNIVPGFPGVRCHDKPRPASGLKKNAEKFGSDFARWGEEGPKQRGSRRGFVGKTKQNQPVVGD